VSLSVCDIDHFVNPRKMLDSIFNILKVFIHMGGGFSSFDIPWLVEYMDFHPGSQMYS
jgi:hypothetical protein